MKNLPNLIKEMEQEVVQDFKAHLASGGKTDDFFKELLIWKKKM